MPWMWALGLASAALGLNPPPLGRFAARIKLGQFLAEGGEVHVWRATLDDQQVVLRFYKGLCVQPTHCTVSELVQRTWQEARANCGLSVAASLRRLAVVRAAEASPAAREQPPQAARRGVARFAKCLLPVGDRPDDPAFDAWEFAGSTTLGEALFLVPLAPDKARMIFSALRAAVAVLGAQETSEALPGTSPGYCCCNDIACSSYAPKGLTDFGACPSGWERSDGQCGPISHHDLKFENVVVDSHGMPWIIDFGASGRCPGRAKAHSKDWVPFWSDELVLSKTCFGYDLYAVGAMQLAASALKNVRPNELVCQVGAEPSSEETVEQEELSKLPAWLDPTAAFNAAERLSLPAWFEKNYEPGTLYDYGTTTGKQKVPSAWVRDMPEYTADTVEYVETVYDPSAARDSGAVDVEVIPELHDFASCCADLRLDARSCLRYPHPAHVRHRAMHSVHVFVHELRLQVLTKEHMQNLEDFEAALERFANGRPAVERLSDVPLWASAAGGGASYQYLRACPPVALTNGAVQWTRDQYICDYRDAARGLVEAIGDHDAALAGMLNQRMRSACKELAMAQVQEAPSSSWWGKKSAEKPEPEFDYKAACVDTEQRSLLTAIAVGDGATVASMLSRSRQGPAARSRAGDPAAELCNRIGETGESNFAAAVRAARDAFPGSLEVVQAMLDHGADPLAVRTDGAVRRGGRERRSSNEETVAVNDLDAGRHGSAPGTWPDLDLDTERHGSVWPDLPALIQTDPMDIQMDAIDQTLHDEVARENAWHVRRHGTWSEPLPDDPERFLGRLQLSQLAPAPPLVLAAARPGTAGVLKALLTAAGSKAQRVRTREGSSLLSVAAGLADGPGVQTVLDFLGSAAGVGIDPEPLVRCAEADNADGCSRLILAGADPRDLVRFTRFGLNVGTGGGSATSVSAAIEDAFRGVETRSPLLSAVDAGSVEAAKVLCAAAPDTASQQVVGRLPLHQAARKADPDMVDALLQCGAAVDQVEPMSGLSALHAAVFQAEQDVWDIPAFVDSWQAGKLQSNPELEVLTGYDASGRTASGPRLRSVLATVRRLLAEPGAAAARATSGTLSLGKTPLLLAAAQNLNEPTVTAILEAAAKEGLDQTCDEHGHNALQIAAAAGSTNALRALAAKMPVDLRPTETPLDECLDRGSSQTALMVAVVARNFGAVETLLELGADACAFDGETPVPMLLGAPTPDDWETDIDVVDRNRIKRSRREVIRVIAESKMKYCLNMADGFGVSLLGRAVYEGDLPIVRQLLDYGVDCSGAVARRLSTRSGLRARSPLGEHFQDFLFPPDADAAVNPLQLARARILHIAQNSFFQRELHTVYVGAKYKTKEQLVGHLEQVQKLLEKRDCEPPIAGHFSEHVTREEYMRLREKSRLQENARRLKENTHGAAAGLPTFGGALGARGWF